MAKEYEYIMAPVQNLEEMEVPQETLEALGACVAGLVMKYFEKEENRKAFEQWYFEKYGKEYVWKTMKASDLKADSN